MPAAAYHCAYVARTSPADTRSAALTCQCLQGGEAEGSGGTPGGDEEDGERDSQGAGPGGGRQTRSSSPARGRDADLGALAGIGASRTAPVAGRMAAGAEPAAAPRPKRARDDAAARAPEKRRRAAQELPRGSEVDLELSGPEGDASASVPAVTPHAAPREEERLVRAREARAGALVVISQQALAASAQARDPLPPFPTAVFRAQSLPTDTGLCLRTRGVVWCRGGRVSLQPRSEARGLTRRLRTFGATRG